MKRIYKFGLASCLLLSTMFLASCGGGPSVVQESGDSVFSKNVYVDLSDLPKKIQFKVDLEASPLDLSIGPRIRVYDNQFQYANGIMTIDSKVLMDEDEDVIISSGEHSVNIRLSNSTTKETTVLFVDKIIRTAADLQSINNKPMGSYVLGNDIDCSSISNFEPLGYMESDTRYNQEFGGIFDGNGYAIKNLTSRYSIDLTNNLQEYEGHTLFTDESHSAGSVWGIFQTIGASGVVRNVALDNCNIYGKTIVGILCGSNDGLIENVLIKDNCSATMSTHYYDDNCNVGAIVGINGNQINNVISLGTANIIASYTDYNDDYLEVDGVNYHVFYGGEKEALDSNGRKTNGVYAGVGKSWGLVTNCFALSFNTSIGQVAAFGQTHLYANKPDDGPDKGVYTKCEVILKNQFTNATIYSDFSSDIWNIYEGSVPSFKAIYPTYII